MGGAMTILQLLVVVTAVESTTLAVKLEVPEAVGVPVMAPVEALSVRPAGAHRKRC